MTSFRFIIRALIILTVTGTVQAQGLTAGKRHDRGVITGNVLTEISGLACSSTNRGIIWVHNDSGGKNEIWGIHSDNSRIAGSFSIQGVRNRDWEDISVGPGPVDGVTYIYIGDIGDNGHSISVKEIIRFPEPDDLSAINRGETGSVSPDIIRFTYPDGNYDAETLLIDPHNRDIYIITKEQEKATVYLLRYPQHPDRITTAEKVGTIPVPMATGGSVSADGQNILVKNYLSLFYWKRNAGQEFTDALKQQPQRLQYIPEPQGEAVGWSRDGTGFFTLSEQRAGMPVHLFYYSCISGKKR